MNVAWIFPRAHWYADYCCGHLRFRLQAGVDTSGILLVDKIVYDQLINILLVLIIRLVYCTNRHMHASVNFNMGDLTSYDSNI